MKRLVILTVIAALTACDGTKSNGNVGLDDVQRTRTSPVLRSFSTCDALAAELRTNLAEEMRTRILQAREYYGTYYFGGGGEVDDAASPGAAEDSDSGGESRTEGVDFSGTNNQESGVDEADLVKTDGFNIYLVNGNRLEIFGVPTFGELTHVSTTKLEGSPSQMLIGGDKVAVFSTIYTWDLPEGHPLHSVLAREGNGSYNWYRTSSLAKITVLDISDRATPTLVRELYLEGYYQTARKVGATVRMVGYSWFDVPGLSYWIDVPQTFWEYDYNDPAREALLDMYAELTIAENDAVLAATALDDLVPTLYELDAAGTLVDHAFTDGECASFATADDAMARGFTSILSVDLLGRDLQLRRRSHRQHLEHGVRLARYLAHC
jgi:hypothetical protein